MHKLDLTITRLRLLVAEVNGKIESLRAMRDQFAEQQSRIMDYTIHEDGHVDRTLSMLMEIDGRADTVARSLLYLERLRLKTQRELDSLMLTKLIEETRSQLNALRDQHNQLEQSHLNALTMAESRDTEKAGNAGDVVQDVQWLKREIQRLEAVIHDASEAAARSVGVPHER